jgi:hypothetical protein
MSENRTPSPTARVVTFLAATIVTLVAVTIAVGLVKAIAWLAAL